MNTTHNMNQGGTGYTGWIIAIVLLVAILLLVTLIPARTAGPSNTDEARMMQQDNTVQMQASDDPQAIQQDIDAQLQTDFQL